MKKRFIFLTIAVLMACGFAVGQNRTNHVGLPLWNTGAVVNAGSKTDSSTANAGLNSISLRTDAYIWYILRVLAAGVNNADSLGHHFPSYYRYTMSTNGGGLITDSLRLIAGSGISITPSGNTMTIATSGGSVPDSAVLSGNSDSLGHHPPSYYATITALGDSVEHYIERNNSDTIPAIHYFTNGLNIGRWNNQAIVKLPPGHESQYYNGGINPPMTAYLPYTTEPETPSGYLTLVQTAQPIGSIAMFGSNDAGDYMGSGDISTLISRSPLIYDGSGITDSLPMYYALKGTTVRGKYEWVMDGSGLFAYEYNIPPNAPGNENTTNIPLALYNYSATGNPTTNEYVPLFYFDTSGVEHIVGGKNTYRNDQTYQGGMLTLEYGGGVVQISAPPNNAAADAYSVPGGVNRIFTSNVASTYGYFVETDSEQNIVNGYLNGSNINRGTISNSVLPNGGIIETELFTHNNAVGDTNTSESILYTDTVGTKFSAQNNKYLLHYAGVFSGDATSTQEVKFYFGLIGQMVNIFDSGALSVGTTASWDLNILIVKEAIITHAKAICTWVCSSSALSATTIYTEVVTSSNFYGNNPVCKLTGIAAGVSGASNQITAEMATGSWKQ
jgi:hypothetical protein